MQPVISSQRQRTVAIAATGLALIAVALDNLVFLPVDESPHLQRFLGFGLACTGVAAAVFLVLAPWAEAEREPGTRVPQSAFALSLGALVTLLVFYTGLPLVLGAGGFLFGRNGEQRAARQGEGAAGSQRASLAWAATVLGALVFAAGVVLFAVTVAA